MGPTQPENTSNAVDLNQELVDHLKKEGLIQTPRVEAAFRSVLRHLFLPGVAHQEVYSDRAISAKQDPEGKWISSSSQPAIMAIMLEQLGLEPGHKVLEIGTGPGYNAALMAHIVGETGQVVTVEIDEDLTQAARQHLAAAGFGQVQAITADGGFGAPDYAPFDRIILTVGAPDITPAWWDQLKPAGRLVLPLLLRGSMKSIAFEQVGDHLASLSVADCGFIPLRGEFASKLPARVQLGPDPNLYLEPASDFTLDSDAVYALLNADHRDGPAEIDVKAGDLLGGPLWTWLALYEPGMCRLVAEEKMIEQNLVPPMIGIETGKRLSMTAVLLDDNGLAALMRPPDQSLPMVPFDQIFLPDSPTSQPFPLFIRQFGADESIPRRLLSHIQAWKAAGSPASNTMHIRAYRKGHESSPSEGEIVLEKEWTRLVFRWPSTP